MIAALLAPLIGPAIEKALSLIPDGNARAKAREDLEKTIIEAANQASIAQTRINEVEAGHASLFVAGWRPFIGWVCGIAIAWSFLVSPLVGWATAIWAPQVVLPVLDTGPLFGLVTAMLGMGGWRAWEKVKGVARNAL